MKTDSLNIPEYAPARRVRRQLVRHLLSERNRDKYCKTGRRDFLNMPLSEALQRFTSCPVDYPFFEVYRVKDLRKKEMITDVELDGLIEYFKEKKNCWMRLPARRSSPTGRLIIGLVVIYYHSCLLEILLS